MRILDDNGRWQGAVAVRLSARFEGNRQPRKKHARLRQRAGGSMRAQSVAIRQGAMEQQKAAKLMRRLKQHLGLLDEEQVWSKGFKIRETKRSAAQSKPKGKKITAGSSRPLPSYRKPLVDKRGRIALYMAISYLGLKSPKWRPGLASEHILYLCRAAAMEIAAMTNGIVSSMGVSPGEIAQGWLALEEVEKAYRANATVQHRFVVNLPHDLSAAGRERVLSEWCKISFGRYGLPYVAIPHLPDPEGNSRNFHAHVCISARPMSRTGDHEWLIGEEKISGFTDPESLKRIRAEFAAVLNRECRREGLEIRYTHQNYRERGIDAKRQEHYGPERTALYRKGEAVDMVERNQARVKRNEAKAELGMSDQTIQAAAKLTDLALQRLALLDRRKNLQRRMKLIDGMLVLVNDVGSNSNVRAQHRAEIMKTVDTKRRPIADLKQRLDRVAAGIRGETSRKIARMCSDEKLAQLNKVRQQLSAVGTKVSSTDVDIGNRLRRLRQQVPKHRAIRHRLGALKTRVEAISKLRERVMARRASFRPLQETIRSFSIEPVPGKLERAAPIVVSPHPDDIERKRVGPNSGARGISQTLENDTPMQANGKADDTANSAGSQSAAKSFGELGNSATHSNTPGLANDKLSDGNPLPKAHASSTGGRGERQDADKSDRNGNANGAPTNDGVELDDGESTIRRPSMNENRREPVTKVPQSPSGTDEVAGQSHAEPEAKTVAAPVVPSSATSSSGQDKGVAPLPSLKDLKPNDSTMSGPAQSLAETLKPTTDEHDALIHRFETARDDKERVAVLIRADKIALERMVLRNDPDWITIDRQYKNQQRIAGGMRGVGGIGS